MKLKKAGCVLDLIGNTPLKQLNNIHPGKGTVWGKLEYYNPGGSVKDRSALQIIKEAYDSGVLAKGQPVIEMTSGNMGAGLAVVCAAMGNPFIAVMPAGNSPERCKILEAMGARVHLTKQVDGVPGMVTGEDMKAAQREAEDMALEMGAYYPDQFNNEACIRANYNTTGPEIWEALDGKVDGFVASIGGASTFVGIAKYLKEMNPDVLTIAVEPANASILSTGKVEDTKHIIQGAGYSWVPPKWDPDVCDRFFPVTDEDCRDMAKRLSREEGTYVGYSAAANVVAASKILEEVGEDLNIVAILCDTAFKYSDL
mmetsp:Transcript_13935/g.15387  ORF Transcript_13935/g.15387 Transcript_13935/m.15387 type:complete len:313 (-) Transcript_13935:312-1250(-)